MTHKSVRDYIRTIVDFPHEGILFRDVTTLFADPRGFRIAIDQLLAPYAGMRFDKVAGLEARGFILGGAVAHQLSTGFVPIRKKGKLPGRTISVSYQLEYGEAVVEVHDDAIQAGEKVLLVDDLLATGGTAEAGIKLIEQLGDQVVGCAFVVDLPDLGGRRRLEAMGMEVHALCAFEGTLRRLNRLLGKSSYIGRTGRPALLARRNLNPNLAPPVAPAGLFVASFRPQHGARVHDPEGVERRLEGAHRPQLRGIAVAFEILHLQPPDPVLGADRASGGRHQIVHGARDLAPQVVVRLAPPPRRREDVVMQVAVAQMAEAVHPQIAEPSDRRTGLRHEARDLRQGQ